MNTAWMLMATYEKPMIEAEVVCRDFFKPLTYKKWLEMVSDGRIALPLTRMTDSARAPRYVSVTDLAAYFDARSDAARRERDSLTL